MHVAGLVAEYNPLHNGHIHHLEETRRMTKCDYIVVCMSGDYVQRGEPAVADKFTRAQWALYAGADLVLELPVVYALGSAERFAAGSVGTLAATGVLRTLSFGSEVDDIAAIQNTAHILSHEPANFKERLREQLSMGKSYPRARYDALQACGVSKEVLAVLRQPNSILGVEYIRFLKQFAPAADIAVVKRLGANYNDNALESEYPSATAIREALYRKDADTLAHMPVYVAARFGVGDVPIVRLEDASQLILYALRSMTPEQLQQLPDVQEGLENTIARAAQSCTTLDSFYTMLKSKRYTLARCKRIALCGMLGITRQLLQSSFSKQAPYLRVLGFRTEARPLISAIGKHGTAPLIMRRADAAQLGDTARALLEKDIYAHDVYAFFNPNEPPLRDFQQPPITLS